MKEEICRLMGISKTSFYRWKEERLVMELLLKYFNKEDLREFIETGKMQKLECANNSEVGVNCETQNNNDLMLVYAIRSLEKFNRNITDYGVPLSDLWEREEIDGYNLLNAVIVALEELDGDSIEDFVSKVSEYTKVKTSGGEQGFLIDLDKALEIEEITEIVSNKERALERLRYMISPLTLTINE